MSEGSFTRELAAFDETQARALIQERFLDGLAPVVGDVGTVGVGSKDEGQTEEALDPSPVFPLNVLPPILQQFIQDAAHSLPVPVDLIAGPVLVCLGSAIGAHRQLRLKPRWKAPASLYMACVSDPGTMKTPALGLAAAPVHSQQSQYSQLFQNALAQNDKDQANYLRELDAYKKNKSDFIPEKPERPVLQRSWTADVTTERLAGILKENPRGVLILRDELSAWIKSFNQYKGGKGADK
jgi:hypothetical protein